MFSHTRSLRYQHIIHFMLHHACVMNNIFLNMVIDMVEKLDGRVHIVFSLYGEICVTRKNGSHYNASELIHNIFCKYLKRFEVSETK